MDPIAAVVAGGRRGKDDRKQNTSTLVPLLLSFEAQSLVFNIKCSYKTHIHRLLVCNEL
jgi:hypothetical protein